MGVACITEINAGRFASMTNLHDLAGQHNMASLYVRLGMGDRVKLPSPHDFADDYYVVRSVDTPPGCDPRAPPVHGSRRRKIVEWRYTSRGFNSEGEDDG